LQRLSRFSALSVMTDILFAGHLSVEPGVEIHATVNVIGVAFHEIADELSGVVIADLGGGDEAVFQGVVNFNGKEVLRHLSSFGINNIGR
jgi:hypothetical protein